MNQFEELIIKIKKTLGIPKNKDKIELQKERIDIYNRMINNTEQNLDFEVKRLFNTKIYNLYMELKVLILKQKILEFEEKQFFYDFKEQHKDKLYLIDQLEELKIKGCHSFEDADKFDQIYIDINFWMADNKTTKKQHEDYTYKGKNLYKIRSSLSYYYVDSIKKHREEITKLVGEIL